MRRAPEWNFDVTSNYEYPLANGDVLAFNANYRWKDDYYIIANTVTHHAVNPGLVESHGILDLSIAYEAENWKASVFGKNVTNTNYFQHVLDVGTTYGGTPTDPTPVALPGLWTYGTIGAPATWGVELQLKF